MQLILIRHGESVWNEEGRVQGTSNPSLSKKGSHQAEMLANKFNNGCKINAVYSSPLARAHSTAKIITSTHDLSINICHDLREIQLGEWEGKHFSQLQQEYPEMFELWYSEPLRVSVPGGETVIGFRDRVVAAMAEIVKRHEQDEKIMIVAHGGVISIYIAHLLEMNLNKIWFVALKNASVSILDCWGDKACLTLFNDTCHLGEGCETW
ncbi:histidine phosphatase family protein [bacterium]|nr:histidine phosphatase family protein [bacterium]MBU1753044.1 histidine phosphatase family protein [bacterium]